MIGNIFQGFQQFSQAAKPLVNLLDKNGNGRIDCGDFKILYGDWCKFQHKNHYALHVLQHMMHNHHAKEHAHQAHENSTHQNKNYSSHHHEQSEQNSKDWTFYCHPNGVCSRGRYP